jgi:hypothetical protein
MIAMEGGFYGFDSARFRKVECLNARSCLDVGRSRRTELETNFYV